VLVPSLACPCSSLSFSSVYTSRSAFCCPMPLFLTLLCRCTLCAMLRVWYVGVDMERRHQHTEGQVEMELRK